MLEWEKWELRLLKAESVCSWLMAGGGKRERPTYPRDCGPRNNSYLTSFRETVGWRVWAEAVGYVWESGAAGVEVMVVSALVAQMVLSSLGNARSLQTFGAMRRRGLVVYEQQVNIVKSDLVAALSFFFLAMVEYVLSFPSFPFKCRLNKFLLFSVAFALTISTLMSSKLVLLCSMLDRCQSILDPLVYRSVDQMRRRKFVLRFSYLVGLGLFIPLCLPLDARTSFTEAQLWADFCNPANQTNTYWNAHMIRSCYGTSPNLSSLRQAQLQDQLATSDYPLRCDSPADKANLLGVAVCSLLIEASLAVACVALFVLFRNYHRKSLAGIAKAPPPDPKTVETVLSQLPQHQPQPQLPHHNAKIKGDKAQKGRRGSFFRIRADSDDVGRPGEGEAGGSGEGVGRSSEAVGRSGSRVPEMRVFQKRVEEEKARAQAKAEQRLTISLLLMYLTGFVQWGLFVGNTICWEVFNDRPTCIIFDHVLFIFVGYQMSMSFTYFLMTSTKFRQTFFGKEPTI